MCFYIMELLGCGQLHSDDKGVSYIRYKVDNKVSCSLMSGEVFLK